MAENVSKEDSDVGIETDNVGNIIKTLLHYLEQDNTMTAAALAERMAVTKRTIERHLKELKETGRLVRHGGRRSGYWEVI